MDSDVAMNVFADFHHGALYHSLSLLFEKRLGGNLFRPIGFDWVKSGYWNYSLNPATIDQYLKPQEHVDILFRDSYFLCPDYVHKTQHKALTLEQFQRTPIDLIIASVANHESSFHALAQTLKPGAKLIRQVGNVNDQVDVSLYKNILASAKLDLSISESEDLNLVIYHPEFDLELFAPQAPHSEWRITNLMNCLPHSHDFPLWDMFKQRLPEFEWKMYGILGEDGILSTVEDVAQAIHRSSFIWHVKWGGDGFGYVIHHAFAAGRPPIVRCSYYADKLAGDLMIPGETCIDLDQFELLGTATQAIRDWASPENHSRMCQAAGRRFREIVDYDKEEQSIRDWLNQLK